MQIINISYSDFFKATKDAFSASNISSVKRDSIVRRFLNHQLFPNQNLGENESRLSELFIDKKEPEPKETHATVVMLEHYENNNEGNILVDVNSYVCIGKDAVNKKLAKLFSNNFPDFDGERMLDSKTITDAIERIALDENDEALIYEEIAEMSSSEIESWMLKNISIDELTEDSFFGDFLNLDTRKIRYEYSEINY